MAFGFSNKGTEKIKKDVKQLQERVEELEKVDMQKVLRNIEQLQKGGDFLRDRQKELEKRIKKLEDEKLGKWK